MDKKEAEVIESIKKIDSELLDIWSKIDILEDKQDKLLQDKEKLIDKRWELQQEKAKIIEKNREIVLENDIRTVTKAIDVFRNICSDEYNSININDLYALQVEIAKKLGKLEENSSVNEVEEEPIEA